MLSFSEWWQKQVNPAWRKLMEDSKQIEYFKKAMKLLSPKCLPNRLMS